ncbi:hypothetical protein ACFQVD_26465 [Streptosporangium amethystogenes subsp. fukuiense]|uniref:Uncharacterized protein n=1 Tax=Streptosporangium amethystogenes subsp. fukuiense TaxID=698418 RepID=A0ABW2T6H7_9ACTN
MGQHLIRDEYGNEFPVDSTALAFWEHREGYTIVGPIPEPGAESAPERPAEPQPDPSGTPKTSSKAASRPAPKVEE